MAQFSGTETYHDHADQELRQAINDSRIAIYTIAIYTIAIYTIAIYTIAIYTTDHVIAELVALMTARRIPRQQILNDVGNIIYGSRIIKLYTDQPLFLAAWELLGQRPDKG